MENFFKEETIQLNLTDECLEKLRIEQEKKEPEKVDLSGILDEGVQDEL